MEIECWQENDCKRWHKKCEKFVQNWIVSNYKTQVEKTENKYSNLDNPLCNRNINNNTRITEKIDMN